MDELKVKGKIERWSMEPKKDGGKFIKLQIAGRVYNFFDTEFFEENESKFKIGNEAELTYYDKKLLIEGRGEITTHTVTQIEFTNIESPSVVKPLQDFQKATEAVHVQEDSIEILMDKCLQKAIELTDKYKKDDNQDFFKSEDVRAIAISIFLEAVRRQR